MIDESSVAITALGIVVTSVGALIWIAKYLMIQNKKSIDDLTLAQTATAKALNKLSVSTDKNTEATISADKYLKERNGRDNEQHTENIQIQRNLVAQIEKVPDIIYSKERQRAVESKAILDATKEIPVTLKKIADDQAKAIVESLTIKHAKIEHSHIEHGTITERK